MRLWPLYKLTTRRTSSLYYHHKLSNAIIESKYDWTGFIISLCCLPESGAGAYLTGDCWGRKAARLPPPRGHWRRRPVLKLYLQKKHHFTTLWLDFLHDKEIHLIYHAPFILDSVWTRIMALFAKRSSASILMSIIYGIQTKAKDRSIFLYSKNWVKRFADSFKIIDGN